MLWISLLFLAIPIALIRLFYKAPILHATPSISDTGYWPVTSNSILLLIFGTYAAVVCTVYLSYCYKLWKEDDPCWEDDIKQARRRTYLAAFMVAVLFAIDVEILNYAKSPFGLAPLGYLGALEVGVIFGSLPFLFVIGTVLLVISLQSLNYRTGRPNSFFVTNLLLAILFILVGILPTIVVVTFWLEGGFDFRFLPL